MNAYLLKNFSQRFSENDWVLVYTDGSVRNNAGAGIYSTLPASDSSWWLIHKRQSDQAYHKNRCFFWMTFLAILAVANPAEVVDRDVHVNIS